MSQESKTPLLEVSNFSVEYPIYGGILGRKIAAVRAVESVSFQIEKGETLGLVGESGCGKSSLGKALLHLIPQSGGKILFQGKDLKEIERDEGRGFRKRMQIIFQDPFSSLNPRMKIGEILEEPLIIHSLGDAEARKKRVKDLLKTVGLREESLTKYPHEFSGGQRQRIGIARALAVEPDFIVADEPVSALDVSIQAQILNLLKQLQKDFKLTYLFVSHDLNIIKYLCDRVVVMYLGRVMEILSREQLTNPQYKKHPYTEALLASAPRKHPNDPKPKIRLHGDIPSPKNPPKGCVFHTRCPEAIDRCRIEVPALKAGVACHLRERV